MVTFELDDTNALTLKVWLLWMAQNPACQTDAKKILQQMKHVDEQKTLSPKQLLIVRLEQTCVKSHTTAGEDKAVYFGENGLVVEVKKDGSVYVKNASEEQLKYIGCGTQHSHAGKAYLVPARNKGSYDRLMDAWFKKK